MTGNTKIERDSLAALEAAFERYGSDRTRWPAPVRRDLAALLADNAEAKQRLAEAEAFDRLLDMMPAPEIDTRALSARILAAAEAETPAHAPAPARTMRMACALPSGPPMPRARPPAGDSPWAAAAVLAASLVLGTVFGVSGTFNSAFEGVVAENSDEASVDPGQLAFGSGAFDMFEEDLL